VTDLATPSRPDPGSIAAKTPVQTYIVRGAERATHHELSLWALAVLTLALDIVTTAYGLQVGLAEMNPFVNYLLPTFGLFGTFVVLKGTAFLFGVAAWWAMPSRLRGVVPLGLTLPWAVAVTSNTALLVGILF
jgi:hypothetical protein